MSDAKGMLEGCGYELKKVHGNYELWFNKPLFNEMTFNVCDGRQVAKVQTCGTRSGPVNCNASVYEAMLARMRERELGIEV